jgi:predicted nucleic acid-binding protein
VILVDTGIWIDFWLERPYTNALARLLEENVVLGHDLVIEELALGHLGAPPVREEALQELRKLPMGPLARLAEVMALVEQERLAGKELNVVGAHLLASSRMANAQLWTRDRRTAEIAQALGQLYRP